MRILVADDHEMIRKGIIQILHEEFSTLETAEAIDTGSLVEKAIGKDWDIIISDISMPGGGGLSAIKKIRQKKRSMPILIVSMHTQQEYVNEAISLGASGFIDKELAPEQLIKALKKILSGQTFFPQQANK